MAGKEANPQGYLDFWGNTPMDPTTAQGKTFAPVSSGNSIANPRPPELKGGQDRILNQIEQSADYYGPAIYQILGYHSSLELTSDFNEDFVPLSQTKSNPKLFVVGLIPPSANITGRVLDRSASIASTEGYPDQELDFSGSKPSAAGGAISAGGSGGGSIVTAEGYTIKQGTGTLSSGIKYPAGNIGPNGSNAIKTQFSIPQLYSIFSQAYRDKFQREPTPTEVQFYTAQCLRETSGVGYNNNFGFMVNYGTTPPPAGTDYFRGPPEPGAPNGKYYKSYGTPESGAKAFIGHLTQSDNVVASAQNGDSLGYVTSVVQTGYTESSVSTYYKGMPSLLTSISKAMKPYGLDLGDGTDLPARAPDCCAFNENQASYMERVAPGSSKNRGRGLKPNNRYRFNSGSPYDANCPLIAQAPQNQDGSNGAWKDSGSANASESRREDSKTSDRIDLNKTELGAKYQNAQRAEAAMASKALDIMRTTPPLRLLVNPTSFKIISEKVVSDGNFTREGPVIEHWGEQQDKMSISGKIAAFFAIDTLPSSSAENLGGGPGLTRVARQYSASYQNFLSLYLLYRNNGGLFVNTLADTLQNNLLSRLSLVGSIYIYYDNTLYIGSFDSFNITESDLAPYSLEYSIEFTVRATFLLDGPTEADFNAQSVFTGGLGAPIITNTQLVSNFGGGDVALPPGLRRA